MEKTKEQVLVEKLRKAARKTHGRMGGGPPEMGPPPIRPGMPPMMGMPPRGPGPGPRRHGARARETILLAVLETGEGGVRQKDIADAVGVNPSTLSEQIDRLEAERYLSREPNPEDRRSTLIVLTEKGKARAYEVLDERQRAASELCEALTDEEKDALIRILGKLLGEED